MTGSNGATSHRWRALGEVHIAPPIAPTPRSFGLTVGGVFAAIAFFSLLRHHIVRSEIAAAIAAVLLLAALIRPASLAPLARGWGRVGHLLGWINSRILLTALFALVLWPIGAASRLFGSDPLGRRNSSGSYWKAYSTRLRDPKHYERMY